MLVVRMHCRKVSYRPQSEAGKMLMRQLNTVRNQDDNNNRSRFILMFRIRFNTEFH